MIKQKKFKNILARQSEMDYSPGMQFQTSIINTDKKKSLTMNNQPGKSIDKNKRYQRGLLEHLRITYKEFPIRLSYQNSEKGVGDGYFSTSGEEGSRRCISRSR